MPNIGSHRDWRNPCCQQGAGSGTQAPLVRDRSPRIACQPELRAIARAHHAKVAHSRLGEEHRAAFAQARNRGSVHVGDLRISPRALSIRDGSESHASAPSLITVGAPSTGPIGSLRRQRSSDALASLSAFSRCKQMTALSVGFRVSIASSAAMATSTGHRAGPEILHHLRRRQGLQLRER